MFSTLPRESDSSFRLATILLTALFGVLTHWNVWDNGVHSIGWNTSITWLALGLTLIRSNQSSHRPMITIIESPASMAIKSSKHALLV